MFSCAIHVSCTCQARGFWQKTIFLIFLVHFDDLWDLGVLNHGYGMWDNHQMTGFALLQTHRQTNEQKFVILELLSWRKTNIRCGSYLRFLANFVCYAISYRLSQKKVIAFPFKSSKHWILFCGGTPCIMFVLFAAQILIWKFCLWPIFSLTRWSTST